jgi:hypothetical protein
LGEGFCGAGAADKGSSDDAPTIKGSSDAGSGNAGSCDNDKPEMIKMPKMAVNKVRIFIVQSPFFLEIHEFCKIEG